MSTVELTEAVEAIREKLIEHRLSRTANLWSTILKQIKVRVQSPFRLLEWPQEVG
jgi:hypothetical protein